MSNIAIIVGIWRMKKWAGYLLAMYFVSKIVVDIAYLLPENRLSVFGTTAIGAALWFWAIARKWKMFS